MLCSLEGVRVGVAIGARSYRGAAAARPGVESLSWWRIGRPRGAGAAFEVERLAGPPQPAEAAIRFARESRQTAL